MGDKKKNHDSERHIRYTPMFLPMGIAMGTAIGVSMDNLALWLCIGVSFALCIGNGLDARNRVDEENEQEDSHFSGR